MSSIAYITDKNMLEFHRLNGNNTMNFWRFQSSKNFTDFMEGDLLFFLAKGSEIKRGKHKEKGIVGYGRLKSNNNYSFSKMWDVYGKENGYATKDDLKQAILKISKDNHLPRKMNCLYLVDVVFFQSPVYLSEIGIEISNSMESFIYLDKDNPKVTTEILKKGRESGVDLWTALLNNNDNQVFEEDEIRHTLFNIFKEIGELSIDTRSYNKSCRELKEFLSNNESYEYLKGSKLIAYKYVDGILNLYMPNVSCKLYSDLYFKIIGYFKVFKQLIEKHCPYSIKIEITVNNQEINKIIKDN